MKRTGVAIIALALLWITATPPSAIAASVKKSKPKAAPKKAPKAKAQKVKVQKPKAQKPAAVPMKKPADIPMVTEAASVSQGCLESQGVPALASRLGMDESRLASLLGDEDILATDHAENYTAGKGTAAENRSEENKTRETEDGGNTALGNTARENTPAENTAAENKGCVAYVAATGGESGVASATFQRPEPAAGKSPIVAVRKTAEGVTVTPGVCDCSESARRVLTLSAHDVSDPSNEVMATIPKSARWQLGVLAPQMIARLTPLRSPQPNLASENPQAKASESKTTQSLFRNSFNSPFKSDLLPASPRQSDAFSPSARSTEVRSEISSVAKNDDYTVRVVLEIDADAEPEHLESVEIIETATGKRVDGVWWLQRPGDTGVFIGMEGASYERLLWQSPVRYLVKSRGVGPAVTTFRRRVATPQGKGKGLVSKVVRVFSIRGFHLGADMMAPKGTEVHAVGDATVSFSGRMGGFGNLVILDHGRGYQTYYAHLSLIETGVKPGAKVVGGEVIGLVGSTGRSTAPHLHFETRKNGKYIDPFDETRQLEFWLLTGDDQERLAMQLLTPPPPLGSGISREERIITGQVSSTPGDNR